MTHSSMRGKRVYERYALATMRRLHVSSVDSVEGQAIASSDAFGHRDRHVSRFRSTSSSTLMRRS
jgi:hypothetical protein